MLEAPWAALAARNWRPDWVAVRRRFNALADSHTTAAVHVAGTLRPSEQARSWTPARGTTAMGPPLAWAPPPLA